MTVITHIRDYREKGPVTLTLRDGECSFELAVPREDYIAAGAPARGDTLTEESVMWLRGRAEFAAALRDALRILAYADNSERALTDKLLHRGVPRPAAEEAVRETVRLGYLCEERQVARIVETEANRALNGPGKIMAKCLRKGYTPPLVRRVLRQMVARGEVDFSENGRRLAEKKLGENPPREQVRALLCRYGYTQGDDAL